MKPPSKSGGLLKPSRIPVFKGIRKRIPATTRTASTLLHRLHLNQDAANSAAKLIEKRAKGGLASPQVLVEKACEASESGGIQTPEKVADKIVDGGDAGAEEGTPNVTIRKKALKNFCDVSKNVPITPRRTRSGKLLSRRSIFKPVVLDELDATIVTQDEINRTLDEIPNLNEVASPKALLSFSEDDEITASQPLVPMLPEIEINTEPGSLSPLLQPVSIAPLHAQILSEFRGFSSSAPTTQHNYNHQSSLTTTKRALSASPVKMDHPCASISFEPTAMNTDVVESDVNVVPEDTEQPISIDDDTNVPTNAEPSTSEDVAEVSIIFNDEPEEIEPEPEGNDELDAAKKDLNKKRKDRRNSIFPRQAIQMLRNFREIDKELINDQLCSSDTATNEPTDLPENSADEDPDTAAPAVKRRRNVKPNRAKKTVKKPVAPKPPKPQSPEPIDTNFQSHFEVDGKIMVSIKVPKANKSGFKKIHPTLECNPLLLVEPTESCLKKPPNESWNGQKHFRWADDTKDVVRELTEVHEFDSDYGGFRKSTFQRSMFQLSRTDDDDE